ncbi:MAG TPA: hypothetical protein GXZ90_01955 [Clostridiales bacterium]|nr:hypothetical protein [Clostridiales bacterium]
MNKQKRQLTDKEIRVIKDMASYATEEEAKLFYKIYNADAEDVYTFFGEDKKKLLNDFITVWNNERLLKVLEKATV